MIGEREAAFLAAWDWSSCRRDRVATCLLCGSRGVPAAECDRYGFVNQWRACAECELSWAELRPTAEAYAEFYRTGAYRHLTRLWSTQVTDPMDAARWWLPQLTSAIGDAHGCRLLDVGGDDGLTAQLLAEHYACREAHCIDPAARQDEEISTTPGWRVKLHRSWGDFFLVEKSVLDTSSDPWLILCHQTIEHLHDPLTDLRQIASMMGPNSQLVMTVVDHAIVLNDTARRGHPRSRAFKIDHPYNYNRRSAGLLLDKAGFRVTSVSNIPPRFLLLNCELSDS